MKLDKNLTYDAPPPRLSKDALEIYMDMSFQFCRNHSIQPKDESPQSKIIALAKANFKEVEGLWKIFTSERGDVNRYLMDHNRSTTAYLLGFHLVNIARGLFLWHRLEQRNPKIVAALKEARPVKIIDLGCGTGALSQSVVLNLLRHGVPKELITVHGYDRIKKFLEIYRFGMESLIPASNIDTPNIELHDLQRNRFKVAANELVIVCLGYVWNETERNPKAQSKILDLIQSQLTSANDTMVMFVEPANQQPSRELMTLRDNLTDYSSILYPCPSSKPCPMLKRTKDWCYSEFSWDKPVIIDFFDKKLKINRSKIACSSVIASSKSLAKKLEKDSDTQTKPSNVIVGRPLEKTKSPGKNQDFSYLICDGAKIEKSVPTDQNATRKLRGSILTPDKLPEPWKKSKPVPRDCRR